MSQSTEKDALDLMTELGRVSVFWGYLDRKINSCISMILRCDDAQTACISTQLDNVAARCRLLISLSHTLSIDREEWVEEFSTILKTVTDQLAPRRNRYLHDQWITNEAGHQRVDRRAKLRKAAAGEYKGLQFDLTIPVTLEDISDLQNQILEAIVRLNMAVVDIEKFNDGAPQTTLLLLDTPKIEWHPEVHHIPKA